MHSFVKVNFVQRIEYETSINVLFGLVNAVVMASDAAGNVRAARSSAFGYYVFDNVEAGRTYMFSVTSKRYEFATQVINVADSINGLDFTALS